MYEKGKQTQTDDETKFLTQNEFKLTELFSEFQNLSKKFKISPTFDIHGALVILNDESQYVGLEN